MKPEFGTDLTGQTQNLPNATELLHAKMAGRAVTRVVHRCNDAKENEKLDLSGCQLMQVPDAVYHLMRHTNLTQCDISQNVIAKLPTKFFIKFNTIRSLDLSYNKVALLPDNLTTCDQLQTLNISHNSFPALPPVIFKLPALKTLLATHNFVTDVTEGRIANCCTLKEVDLRENPLSRSSHKALSEMKIVRISPYRAEDAEDWEDLNV